MKEITETIISFFPHIIVAVGLYLGYNAVFMWIMQSFKFMGNVIDYGFFKRNN